MYQATFDEGETYRASSTEEISTREQLLRAGIYELHEHGIEDFSIRRVAAACGVSCAAPYRHFKNKEDFIASVFRFITRKWYTMQNVILSEYEDVRERLIEMSVGYVRFLVDNPDYYRILLLHADSVSRYSGEDRPGGLSACMRGLIANYCAKVNMSDSDRQRKVFIVRSMLYGATLMILNEELSDSEETFDMLRCAVAREFDIE